MSRAAAAVLALAVLALAVLAPGCGGRPRAREVPAHLASPQGCVLKVFFATTLMSGRQATRREIRFVHALLVRSSPVRTFAFVSKRLALRRMARLHPEIATGLPGNPLPPSYEIVPRSTAAAAALEGELRRAPGVERVSVSKAC